MGAFELCLFQTLWVALRKYKSLRRSIVQLNVVFSSSNTPLQNIYWWENKEDSDKESMLIWCEIFINKFNQKTYIPLWAELTFAYLGAGCVVGVPELSLFFFPVFWPCCMACRILVSQSGIKPVLPAVETWCLNHWTAREGPKVVVTIAICFLGLFLYYIIFISFNIYFFIIYYIFINFNFLLWNNIYRWVSSRKQNNMKVFGISFTQIYQLLTFCKHFITSSLSVSLLLSL